MEALESELGFIEKEKVKQTKKKGQERHEREENVRSSMWTVSPGACMDIHAGVLLERWPMVFTRCSERMQPNRRKGPGKQINAKLSRLCSRRKPTTDNKAFTF